MGQLSSLLCDLSIYDLRYHYYVTEVVLYLFIFHLLLRIPSGYLQFTAQNRLAFLDYAQLKLISNRRRGT